MRFPSRALVSSAIAVLVGGLLVVASSPILAEDGKARFKAGDRVEVEQFGEWQPGVVVGIDEKFGLVEVRLDDTKGRYKDMPDDVRDRFLTTRARAGNVRLAKKAAAQPKEPQKERTWKDRSGKFSIPAKFMEMLGETVVLQRNDGKRVEILLSKLSDDDIKYVRGLVETENPFAVAGDSTSGTASNAAATTTDETDAPPELKPLRPNWREVKLVRAKTFSTWSFTPESKVPPLDPKLNCPRIVLEDIPQSDKFFEEAQIFVSDDGRRAMVAREQGKVAQNRQLFLQNIDLASGKASVPIPAPKGRKVLDAWPADGVVLYRPDEWGWGKNTVLTLARLENGKLAPVTSWTPYGKEEHESERDVEDAWFLGPNRVLTSGGPKTALTIWDVSAAKALINIPLAHSVRLQTAMSRDHRILAILMSDGIALVDLEAGSHVATVLMERMSAEQQFDISGLAFRDDMRRLAVMSNKGIAIFDLTTGKKLYDFWHPTLTMHSNVNWAGEFLFAGDRYLLDADRKILLWEYAGAGHWFRDKQMHGGRIWAVTRSDRHQSPALSRPLCRTPKRCSSPADWANPRNSSWPNTATPRQLRSMSTPARVRPTSCAARSRRISKPRVFASSNRRTCW